MEKVIVNKIRDKNKELNKNRDKGSCQQQLSFGGGQNETLGEGFRFLWILQVSSDTSGFNANEDHSSSKPKASSSR
jgi:hypothetical protein